MNKIDFACIVSVRNCNPNGDPLNGNRPRINFSGIGEMSDVCIKRKIRNRLQDMGECIFVQSDDRCDDGSATLKERADKYNDEVKFMAKGTPRNEQMKIVCDRWFDVRAFGQVFAFTAGKAGEGVSIGVRGPVTVQSAFSVEPVTITSIQITKSVSGDGSGEKKAADTMGTKHRIDSGVYVFYGSINPQLAERTGFSEEDANKVKEAIRTIFENDESSARPSGSMEMSKLFWWQHNCPTGQYNSAKVHKSLTVSVGENGEPVYTRSELNGLSCEEIDG